MADFLVLEEDGTSHLELEESTSDLLLEDGTFVYTKTGIGLAGLTTSAPGQAVVPSYATWAVGTITVPSSAGTQTIAGLPGSPQAVFFFGTNWTTEDTAVTGNGLGLFRGMVAPQYDSPSTLTQNAATVVVTPSGNAHLIENNAINMINTSGSAIVLYAANVTSLTSDGFVLDWVTATAGDYKVVYVALMDVANVGSFIAAPSSTPKALGFKAGASLLHGAWGSSSSFHGSDRTQEFYGGAAYPGSSGASWEAASLTAFCFPTSSSGQYLCELRNQPPSIVTVTGGHFTGPFLISANNRAYPTGAGLTNFQWEGDTANIGMIVAWDDEDSATGRTLPASTTGNTSTVTGLPFAPGLLIGYSVSDEPTGQGTGSRGAVGLFVATPDFQWCATVDGKSSQGAFQSFQRGFADVVNGASVHAGTVALTNDGFVMTTEEDDVASVNVVWHAFGHPERVVMWIPQIYRRLN